MISLEELWNWLAGPGGIAIGIAATKLYDWIKDWRKIRSETKIQENDAAVKVQEQKSNIDLKENEQALQIYRDLYQGYLGRLEKNVENLMTNVSSLQKDHSACREENAALRAEIAMLKQQLKELESRVSSTSSDK